MKFFIGILVLLGFVPPAQAKDLTKVQIYKAISGKAFVTSSSNRLRAIISLSSNGTFFVSVPRKGWKITGKWKAKNGLLCMQQNKSSQFPFVAMKCRVFKKQGNHYFHKNARWIPK